MFGNSPVRYALAVAADTVEVRIASSRVTVAATIAIAFPENWSM